MAKSDATPTFTQSAEALEEIVEAFRTGELSLEESLTRFEEGVGHLKVCQETLNAAKGKVEVLVKNLQADGKSVTQPFGDEDE